MFSMNNSGIPARLMGLSGALLQHVLALVSLAGLEARQLLKRSLVSILIFVGVLVFVFIGYVALLATLVSIVIIQFGASLSLTLGGVALFHFMIAVLLIFLLRRQQNEPAFAITLQEIQRDIEALTADSRGS